MPTELVTLADVRAEFPIVEGNTDFDTRLTRLLRTASSQIETATGRQMTYGARVETFDTALSVNLLYDLYGTSNEDGVAITASQQRFVLKAAPVDTEAAFEVRYDPNRIFGDDTILPASAYVLDAYEGTLRLLAGTAQAPAALRVSYSGGFNLSGDEQQPGELLPEDIREACMSQIKFLWTKGQPENAGQDTDRSRGSSPAGRFNTPSGLIPEAAALVARYKRLLMGRG